MRGEDELDMKQKENRKQININHTRVEIVKRREYNFSPIPEQMAGSRQTE